ncbi:sigma-70 family RNA polymerase sigma factor [Sphingomonas colocasiae]|uniref:Sigma-70 family RNA polymerase sigma factor n=1 Tax=Sphingomonas colocasiae TaxID=1848973 RepID=A0ABS7PQZ8_9SPHN|nr:sigma-70 family RNA polymerase sigma factor [Sphingomonas colocasiae]MBY8823671.1 sigma-70 family RNA polymerase sigma factor [Sphingomonas colocasiae]
MASGMATIDMEGLYSGHGDWLRGWLRRYTRCSDRAADLAQDTFCKLIESPVSGAPHNPRPYLATVARRLMIDQARRMEVERTFLEAHAALMAGAAAPCPERIAAAIGELNIVVRALETLSERARRAFLRARLDGAPHAEIAAELGVSKSMVKQYVAKGYACCYAAAYGAGHDIG